MTEDVQTAALRDEAQRHRRRRVAITVLAVGLMEHAALGAVSTLGIAMEAGHPTDMPFGLVYGSAFLGCALFSLLCAAVIFCWLRSIKPGREIAALAAGTGMIAAPVVGPVAFVALAFAPLFSEGFLPGSGLAGCAVGAGLAVVGTYLLVAAVLTSRQLAPERRSERRDRGGASTQ